LGLSAPAGAEVLIAISKAQQAMTVSINGAPTYNWAVSTGVPGRDTPSGRYIDERLAKVYYSKKFDDAPMPNSVFFHEGYAIHGTNEEARLGTPASHGCVRLSRANAVTLQPRQRAGLAQCPRDDRQRTDAEQRRRSDGERAAGGEVCRCVAAAG
jgi:lipoprotein-anchoring transpeptidase ErfK/SrfK